MTNASAVETATRRLQHALDALEAALERRREVDRRRADLAAQVHAHDADRARLAADLDRTSARARRLEATNREIAERLDAAIDAIRAAIDGREG